MPQSAKPKLRFAAYWAQKGLQLQKILLPSGRQTPRSLFLLARLESAGVDLNSPRIRRSPSRVAMSPRRLRSPLFGRWVDLELLWRSNRISITRRTPRRMLPSVCTALTRARIVLEPKTTSPQNCRESADQHRARLFTTPRTKLMLQPRTYIIRATLQPGGD